MGRVAGQVVYPGCHVQVPHQMWSHCWYHCFVGQLSLSLRQIVSSCAINTAKYSKYGMLGGKLFKTFEMSLFLFMEFELSSAES